MTTYNQERYDQIKKLLKGQDFIISDVKADLKILEEKSKIQKKE